MKNIINDQLQFAENNLEIANDTIKSMITRGDLSINGELETAENTLKSIKEYTKSIQEKMAKLKEWNIARKVEVDKFQKND